MKYLLTIVLLISCAALLVLGSCCSCTEIACISTVSPDITLTIDLAEHPELTVEELRNISAIRTDLDFNPIDTVQFGFNPTAFQGTEHQLVLNVNHFEVDAELFSFNFILENNLLNQVDTISTINYRVIEREQVCNTCSGWISCSDETYINRSFEEGSFSLNGRSINSLSSIYEVE